MLAVAYTQNLVVVDTLSKYNTPIDLKREWGSVNAIAVDQRRGRLIFGTKGGQVVVSDIKDHYKHVCIISLGSTVVTSISVLHEICAVAAEDGAVVSFSTSDTSASERRSAEIKVNCVTVVDEMIVAGGDSNRLCVWRAK
jgi:hypothetical protein